MSRFDVDRARTLAANHTLEEIVAMAVQRNRKDMAILTAVRVVFLLCFVVVAYLLFGTGTMLARHPVIWTSCFIFAFLTPGLVLNVGIAGLREGKVIALAHFIKSHPTSAKNIGTK